MRGRSGEYRARGAGNARAMTEQSPHEGSREAEAEMREAMKEKEPDVREMERRSAELEEDVERVEKDWESKESDPSVPGAQEDKGSDALSKAATARSAA